MTLILVSSPRGVVHTAYEGAAYTVCGQALLARTEVVTRVGGRAKCRAGCWSLGR